MGKKAAKILLVDWVDSCSNPGWKSSDELESAIVLCQTVGFFVSETKSVLTLALSRGTEEGFKPFADLIYIPKVAITRRRIIQV
ncbi:MAG: hypothetical protein WBV94_09055 [Blastocatellia bacterium]